MEHRHIPQESWVKKTLKRVGLVAGLLIASEQTMEHAAHAKKPIAGHTNRDPSQDAAAVNYLESRIKRRKEDGVAESTLIHNADDEVQETGLITDIK